MLSHAISQFDLKRPISPAFMAVSSTIYIYIIIIPYSKIPCGPIRYQQEQSTRARDREWTQKKMKWERERKKVDQAPGLEANNRASVPRRVFTRAVFCPVARTSKWNPVRGTKPCILVDKLSFTERNTRSRARTSLPRYCCPVIHISPLAEEVAGSSANWWVEVSTFLCFVD